MIDEYDDGRKISPEERLRPLNIKKKQGRQTAVALKDGTAEGKIPEIKAAGRGKIAEKILQLAYENGIRVREDSALAEMLAGIEIDSPIPSEAFMAVAEILSYVYRANGQPNPFEALHEDATRQKE
ncbi:MAG: EscU/YscU/HrcU family type III secretion system export apparatus switch protein [Alphaproteobacteria bacterium]|nr:EscU/YscU/HrcU family type III secretion system export apparatus switch protein [Alphaproteobacteria bacterium]